MEEVSVLLTEDGKYVLYEYENEEELEKIVKEHVKEIFGDDSLYFDKKILIESIAGTGTIPDGYLIDLPNNRFYVVEIELSKHDVNKHIRGQIDNFEEALENPESRKKIINKIRDEILKNPKLKSRVDKAIRNTGQSAEIYDFLEDLFHANFGIIVIIDEITDKLREVCRKLRKYGHEVQEEYFETYKRPSDSYIRHHIHKFRPFELSLRYHNILINYGPRQIAIHWNNLSDAEKEQFRKYCRQKCGITGEEWESMSWKEFLDLYRKKTKS